MLAPWKKTYDQPKQHIKKPETLLSYVKAMVFPVVMYGCESRTIKKAEHQRIAASELWCWRRLLRIPWTAKNFPQFIVIHIVKGFGIVNKAEVDIFSGTHLLS